MKVAIIGAGIVGSTSAYYLSKSSDVELTVFDYGIGQATKASAGIISPWFSKRRNKAWYRLARLGADFYTRLIEDLAADGYSSDFYQQSGVYLLKRDETKLDELYSIAENRREESPLIGELAIVSRDNGAEKFEGITGFSKALYASGGAKISGQSLTKTLLEAAQVSLVKKKVQLQKVDRGWQVDGQFFDSVILAMGAWLPELLSGLVEKVDVRPQKGQLRDLELPLDVTDFPVIMPEGELDIIPLTGSCVSVGATHENEKKDDLTPDYSLLDAMQGEASEFWPSLKEAKVLRERVGTRAYTSDFSPFFGPLVAHPGLYVASGLGSSGLTTGPIIGNAIANLILEQESQLDWKDYDPSGYVQ